MCLLDLMTGHKEHGWCPHRHGEDELQHRQAQSRGIDEASARKHKVSECSLTGVTNDEALMTPLIVPATGRQSQQPRYLQPYKPLVRGRQGGRRDVLDVC